MRRHGVLLLCGWLAVACEPASRDDGRVRVVATTGMIADAARVLSSDELAVEGLMGPGVDPHLYSASREDQRRLIRADLVLYHGLHLEGKMGELLGDLREKRSGGQIVVAVAEAVPPDRLFRNAAFSQYPDPHVWFDLRLWELVVDRVAEALGERVPERATVFESRLKAYRAELREAHVWATEQCARIPARWRKLVTSHDAYNYFGRAYGLEVRGLQGISTDTQAGLDEIRKAVLFIREHEIPVIFAETSVPHNAIEQVARESGARVCPHELYSDALGPADSPEASLLGVFRHNVRTIVEALSDSSSRE